MIRAASLIEKVARYLTDFDSTDPEFQHVEWSKTDLLDYLQTAITMVSAASLTASVCRTEVELGDDAIIEIPEQCSELLKILGFVDSRGELHTNINLQKNEEEVYTSTRPVCAASRTSSPTNFTVRWDKMAGDFLTIDPAQPGGKLLLACSCTPEINDANGTIRLGSKYEPVVFWWMVSMAFGTDIESVPMRERSDMYWGRGADILLMLDPDSTIPRRNAR